jgi:hypothetical protein
MPTICRVWWNEEVQTLDCGEEAAVWFSRYILGKDEGARLGYYLQQNPAFRRDISKVKLTTFQQHYKKLHNHDVVSASQISVKDVRCIIQDMLCGEQSMCSHFNDNCRFYMSHFPKLLLKNNCYLGEGGCTVKVMHYFQLVIISHYLTKI